MGGSSSAGRRARQEDPVPPGEAAAAATRAPAVEEVSNPPVGEQLPAWNLMAALSGQLLSAGRGFVSNMAAGSELVTAGRELLHNPRAFKMLSPPHSVLTIGEQFNQEVEKLHGVNHVYAFGMKMGGIWPKAWQKLSQREDIVPNDDLRQSLARFLNECEPPNVAEVFQALLSADEDDDCKEGFSKHEDDLKSRFGDEWVERAKHELPQIAQRLEAAEGAWGEASMEEVTLPSLQRVLGGIMDRAGQEKVGKSFGDARGSMYRDDVWPQVDPFTHEHQEALRYLACASIGAVYEYPIVGKPSTDASARDVELQVSASKGATFFLVGQQVWGCGQNRHGQLGLGHCDHVPTPQPVHIPERRVRAVSAGAYHTVFLMTDGTAWTCGYNRYGECARHHGQKATRSPVEVMRDVEAIAAGMYHTAFLRKSGSVATCGYNGYGTLGLGHTDSSSRPTDLPLQDVVAISAGAYHNAFITGNGTAWTCGYNSHGQLGNGKSGRENRPIRVPIGQARDVSCGYYHTVFLTNDAKAWTCGHNGYGQLGRGGDPYQVLWVSDLRAEVKAISASTYHTAFAKEDGSAWTCGYNGYGELGDGTREKQATPVQVLLPSAREMKVKSILARDYLTALIVDEGGKQTIWTCGLNDAGQLGIGSDLNNRSKPTRLCLPRLESETEKNAQIIKIAIKQRKSLIEQDFALIKLITNPTSPVRAQMARLGSEPSGSAGDILKFVANLEKGIYEEFNLHKERECIEKAAAMLNAHGRQFLDQWRPDAMAFVDELSAEMVDSLSGRWPRQYADQIIRTLFRDVAEGMVNATSIEVPRVNTPLCSKRVMVMSRARGKTLKDINDNAKQVEGRLALSKNFEWESRDTLTLLRAGVNAHLVVDFVGWTLLGQGLDDDAGLIVHADPHPGNFMHDWEIHVSGKGVTPHVERDETNLAGRNLEETYRAGVKYEIASSTLTVIDWGSSLEHIPGEAVGSHADLRQIRRAMRQIVKGFLVKSEYLVIVALEDQLHLDFRQWFYVFKTLMLDARDENAKEHLQQLRQQQGTLPESLGKLLNILLLVSGLVMQINNFTERQYSLCERWHKYIV